MNHEECLTHHGIKGQKWGVRRWQNKDGSLTKAGQKRYNKEMENLKTEKKKLRNQERTRKKLDKLKKMEEEVDDLKKGVKREESPEAKREHLLKETDPKELYKNKDLLTTAELNERMHICDFYGIKYSRSYLISLIPAKNFINSFTPLRDSSSSSFHCFLSNASSFVYKIIHSLLTCSSCSA